MKKNTNRFAPEKPWTEVRSLKLQLLTSALQLN